MNLKAIRNMEESVTTVSAFNQGHAKQIFDKVDEVGHMVVLKNNKRKAVILSPKIYDAIFDMLHEYMTYEEAARRIAMREDDNTVPFTKLMEDAGITAEDLEGWEDVELE